MRQKIAFASYLLGGLIPLIFGVIDATTTRFRPFHEVAAGMKWEDVPPGLQTVFETMMPLSGLNLTGFSLALLAIVIFGIRRREAWADWSLLAIMAVIALIAAYLLYDISARTGATFPWFGPLIALAFFVVGFVLSTNRRIRS